MLKQGAIKIGDSFGFIDSHSPNCKDGKPCDSSGCTIYHINGKRIRERDFKQYRKFSPQFRQYLICQFIQENDLSLTMASCSCSKCGTVSIDRAFWM